MNHHSFSFLSRRFTVKFTLRRCDLWTFIGGNFLQRQTMAKNNGKKWQKERTGIVLMQRCKFVDELERQ